MVRKTVGIPMFSKGLNTEVSDLNDLPAYTKDELNVDILQNDVRARRLGIDYELGYKLSNKTASEGIEDYSQVTKTHRAFSCYEWQNYRGDGRSLMCVQNGETISFFSGVNDGVLSDGELEFKIELDGFAVKTAAYAFTVTDTDSNTSTGYCVTVAPIVGDTVYSSLDKKQVIGTIVSISGTTYTLDNDSTMVRDSTSDAQFLTDDYKNTEVSYAAAYGSLFICSPYIEIVRVNIKDGYTFSTASFAQGSINVSSIYYRDRAKPSNMNGWDNHTVVVITKKDGTRTEFRPFTYGSVGPIINNTTAFVNAFNNAPSALRQGVTCVGQGGWIYKFSAPSGIEYNDMKIDLYAHGYGRSKHHTYNIGGASYYNASSSAGGRWYSTKLYGATETNYTVDGYTDASSITLQIRDLTGIEEPGHPANDEMPVNLSNEHKYNLLNQGWDDTHINSFKSSKGVYPSNALQWFLLKGANESFTPGLVDSRAFGTSLAPRGKFILNAYEKNRGSVSGISAIPPSPYADHRPEDICFFAGRLWYALDSSLLYSQIVSEDTTLADRCYQAADPTSEEISDIVATDGGVMNLHDCGKIVRIAPLGNGLVAFGTRAVIGILPGNATGFTPTSYYQQVISTVGVLSKRSVVSVGDAVYYWSPLGIYVVAFNENGQLVAQNISFGTIHSWFKNLKPVSKENCIAKLNAIKNEISFLYPTDPESPKKMDGVLKYNVVEQTWTPRNIPVLNIASPFIVDAAELRNPIDTSARGIVEVNGQTVYANNDPVVVKKKNDKYIGYDALSYLVVDGNSFKTTFANCTDIEHLDWKTGDIDGAGYSFDSYITSHPLVFSNVHQYKQAPYVTTIFERTEEGNLFQSGCFMSARWDWSLNEGSYMWDSKQQVYRPGEFYKLKEYVTTKTRVRGSGKSLQLHFESDGDKDFRIAGIGIDARGWER